MHELGEEVEREAEGVRENAEIVEKIFEGKRVQVRGLPAQLAGHEAVDEQQHVAYDQGHEAQGGNAHQQRRVLQHAQDDRHHRQQNLHQIALSCGVGRHDGQRRQEIGHYDHGADAGTVQRHEQRKVK